MSEHVAAVFKVFSQVDPELMRGFGVAHVDVQVVHDPFVLGLSLPYHTVAVTVFISFTGLPGLLGLFGCVPRSFAGTDHIRTR